MCSNHLRDFMIARGYPSDRIGVVKFGIPMKSRNATDTARLRAELRATVLQVAPSDTVILTTARIDAQKRPLLLPVGLIGTELRREAKISRDRASSRISEMNLRHVDGQVKSTSL